MVQPQMGRDVILHHQVFTGVGALKDLQGYGPTHWGQELDVLSDELFKISRNIPWKLTMLPQ